jgi:hypothetical protein
MALYITYVKTCCSRDRIRYEYGGRDIVNPLTQLIGLADPIVKYMASPVELDEPDTMNCMAPIAVDMIATEINELEFNSYVYRNRMMIRGLLHYSIMTELFGEGEGWKIPNGD